MCLAPPCVWLHVFSSQCQCKASVPSLLAIAIRTALLADSNTEEVFQLRHTRRRKSHITDRVSTQKIRHWQSLVCPIDRFPQRALGRRCNIVWMVLVDCKAAEDTCVRYRDQGRAGGRIQWPWDTGSWLLAVIMIRHMGNLRFSNRSMTDLTAFHFAAIRHNAFINEV